MQLIIFGNPDSELFQGVVEISYNFDIIKKIFKPKKEI